MFDLQSPRHIPTLPLADRTRAGPDRGEWPSRSLEQTEQLSGMKRVLEA
jgi:hypothetical protein